MEGRCPWVEGRASLGMEREGVLGGGGLCLLRQIRVFVPKRFRLAYH